MFGLSPGSPSPSHLFVGYYPPVFPAPFQTGWETGIVNLVSVVCLPIFLFKQLMNFIQLWESIQIITYLDQQDWLAAQKKNRK